MQGKTIDYRGWADLKTSGPEVIRTRGSGGQGSEMQERAEDNNRSEDEDRGHKDQTRTKVEWMRKVA
jgi:hypothetical protein